MRTNRNSPAAVFFKADAYKLGHAEQYPENTEIVYSNWTNRGSRIAGIDHVVHFGLQAAIQDLTEGFDRFFAADVEDAVADYEARITEVLGPQYVSSQKIRDLHALGYLPLRFSAVPEGTLVPLRVPSFTVENTTPEAGIDPFWLTNFVETFLSASVWAASTSATLSWDIRRMLDAHAAKTSDIPEFVDWQAHDFSFRGMSSVASAEASGAGHLLSFTGTDTLVALDWIKDNYEEEFGTEPILLGASIPATEHSVMCAGGEDDEIKTYTRLLTEVYANGNVSIVSDTWDYWEVLTGILPKLKNIILGREGRTVIRPDSGDPVQIICGTVPSNGLLPGGTPEQKGSYEVLWDLFGGTVNSKGLRVLHPNIGLIYGDSITKDRAKEIILRLKAKGFSADNMVFGFGSFFFQYQTRDTFMSAMKATWVRVAGVAKNIKKDPKTDSGTKKSATGRLAVHKGFDGTLSLIENASPQEEAASLIQPIWEDGAFIRYQPFSDVRATLRASTKELIQNGTLS